jgi:hypothetical protein
MDLSLITALNLAISTGILGIVLRASFQAGKLIQRIYNLESRVHKLDGLGVNSGD